MTCPACLHENEEWAKYCADCGRGLNGQLLTLSNAAMGVWSDRERQCSNCGEMIPARTRFCAQCGTSAAHASIARTANPLVDALVTGVIAVTSLAVTIFQTRPK